MRATGLSAFLILAAALGATPGYGQARKETKAAPPANEVRYITSIGGIMDDQADTVLKETRTAGKVTAAVLDVCYPAGAAASGRKDRFVANLTIDGQKLTGATESIVGKQPVSVGLTRKASANGVSFEGKVTVGGSVSTISSADNSDISEREYKAGQEADDEIVATPSDYTTASPEAVAARLKPEAVVDFVNSLRGQNVEVSLSSLLPSCTELRKGEQVVRMNIDPERAAEFVARLKSTPGVIAAGWTNGKLDMERTIRFAAADFRDGAHIAKDKLAATVSATIAKALGATAAPAKWNEDSGELKLVFRRPNAALPGLALTETLEFSALVATEKPAGGDRLVLWLSFPSISNADESSGAKLKIVDASDSNGEDSLPADEGDTLTAVARALKAQRWDSENATWK
jgi:hypothetical protein